MGPPPERSRDRPGAEGRDEPPPAGTLRQEAAAQVRDLVAPVRGAPRAGGDWKRLFDVDSPYDLLERLAEGDPLGLRSRGICHLQRTAVAVHADRLFTRSLAMLAYKGMLYTGRPPLEDWLEGVVLAGARDLVRADLDAELAGTPLEANAQVGYRFMQELFGVEPALTRLAAVRFNLLPAATRRVLWAVVLEGRPLASQSAGDAAERYQAGVQAISELKPVRLSDLAELGEDET